MENVIASSAALESPVRPVRWLVWTGRILTGLITSFLLVDAVGKLIPLAPYVEGTKQVGYAVELLRPLGLLLAIPTLLHLIPRTQFLGALLLTAYFGGAVATHLRVGTSAWFPVVFCVILWAAYVMRSARLRAFLRTTLQ
ncbi:MAG TPA: DoxX family protein [Polyangiaceae bacterium]|nr:DoxX family protein [Polyangiaceae bacterium]